MKLTCFKTHAVAAELVPARSGRDWMDKSTDRFAYRCSPMTAANALGWELLVPETFSATWKGGNALNDISFEGDLQPNGAPLFATSHFGHGIITFHPGYLFCTDPGWGIICRGPPNWPKDGIVALDGWVEFRLVAISIHDELEIHTALHSKIRGRRTILFCITNASGGA